MLDSIVKALTVQISAEDLTGGAWSSLTKGTKDVWNNVTAMNQAWELGSKIYGAAVGTLQAGLEKIASAGEYNEARAGFAAMAESHGQSAEYMTRRFLEVTEGLVGIESATKAMSQAMRYGFNADQTAEIWAFSNKFTDTFGGSMETVAARLEELIYKGDKKSLKALQVEFGLVIEKGESWASVADKIKAKMDQMGDGAYNLGDGLLGIGNAWAKVEKDILAEANNLIGEYGFGGLANEIKRILWDIAEEGKYIANALFIPIFDVGKNAFESLMVPSKELFNFFFDGGDDVKIMVNTLAQFAGNMFYTVLGGAEQAWNFFLGLVIEPTKLFMAGMEKLANMTVAGKNMWGLTPEDLKTFESMKGLLNSVYFDTEGLMKQQTAYNDKLAQMATAIPETKKKIDEAHETNAKFGAGLERVGQGFENAGKSAKKAKDEVETLITANMRWNVLSSTTVDKKGKEITVYNEDYYGVGNNKIPTASTGASQLVNIPQTAQGATNRGGPLKIEVAGKDGALKELVEELIERITTKAVAEGLITAGV